MLLAAGLWSTAEEGGALPLKPDRALHRHTQHALVGVGWDARSPHRRQRRALAIKVEWLGRHADSDLRRPSRGAPRRVRSSLGKEARLHQRVENVARGDEPGGVVSHPAVAVRWWQRGGARAPSAKLDPAHRQHRLDFDDARADAAHRVGETLPPHSYGVSRGLKAIGRGADFDCPRCIRQ
eukprot:scaffold17877_cov66-Phaeocystis_antarctica.AAC.1